MEKMKVLKVSSKECFSHRIDYFLMKNIPTLPENVCGFVSDLGVDVNEFDIEDYLELEDVLVGSNKDCEVVVMTAGDGCIWMMVSSNIKKSKIMDIFDKYFFA